MFLTSIFFSVFTEAVLIAAVLPPRVKRVLISFSARALFQRHTSSIEPLKKEALPFRQPIKSL